MSEDKYRNRYKELKKRIRDIEEDNDMLTMRLYKARKSIRHLKLERTFLLDRVEKIQDPALDSGHSDAGSDGYLNDESEVQKYRQNGKHADPRGRIEKILSKPPRRKKDPNAPKGPGNVFFLYCRLERDKIKDEFPQENLGEVTKILGQKWKGLTKEEKQKYYDMYKKEVEEYEEAMKTYMATETPTAGPPASLIGLSAMSSPVQSSLAEYPHHDPLEDGQLMMDDEEEDEEEDIESMAASPLHESSASTSWPTGMADILVSKPDEASEDPTPVVSSPGSESWPIRDNYK